MQDWKVTDWAENAGLLEKSFTGWKLQDKNVSSGTADCMKQNPSESPKPVNFFRAPSSSDNRQNEWYATHEKRYLYQVPELEESQYFEYARIKAYLTRYDAASYDPIHRAAVLARRGPL
jgi:hypothetical protein